MLVGTNEKLSTEMKAAMLRQLGLEMVNQILLNC